MQFDWGETGCRGLADDNMGEGDVRGGHLTRSSNTCEDGEIKRRTIRTANSPDSAPNKTPIKNVLPKITDAAHDTMILLSARLPPAGVDFFVPDFTNTH